MLTAVVAKSSETVSIAALSAVHCPVCQMGTMNNDTFKVFHQAHVHSRNARFPELHQLLTEVIGNKLFQNNDTLAYYAELMLAHTQHELGLTRGAIEAYEQLLVKWSHAPMEERLFIQTEIATNHFSQGKYEEALFHYRSIAQSDGFDQAIRLQDAVFVGMGLCFQYQTEANPDSAVHYLNRAIAVQNTLQDSLDLARSYLNLGGIHFMELRDDSARKYWDLALHMATQQHITDILDDLHFNFAQLHEEAGNFPMALAHYRQYIGYQDSIWNRDRLWDLAEQKKQFEVKLKEDEIMLLEKDQVLQAAELTKQRTARNALLGISLALVAILLLLAVLYQTTRKKNQIIEEQKERLDRLNSTKNQLFSIVAHDLRAPVQALGRNNQLLQHELEVSENVKGQQLLKANQQGIESTYRLLDNLLHWSLSQTESLFLQLERLQLKAIIDQVHYNFIPLIQEKHLEFENKIPAQQLVSADLNTLKIVLRNLLDNAIRFTPENGAIIFEIEPSNPGKVVFSISDTGKGVKAEAHHSIFEMPGDKTSAPDASGKTSSGLGLFLCRELLKQNNGTIDIITSQAGGAKFTIELNLP